MSKPLMERRRRQRINDCLDQLKSILETFTHKQVAFFINATLVYCDQNSCYRLRL